MSISVFPQAEKKGIIVILPTKNTVIYLLKHREHLMFLVTPGSGHVAKLLLLVSKCYKKNIINWKLWEKLALLWTTSSPGDLAWSKTDKIVRDLGGIILHQKPG